MSGAPQRTQALRLLAHELSVATDTITFSDAEKAPKFQLLPSGGRANRVFVVGTVTEIDDVGTNQQYLRAKVVDPNGDPFFAYAGQYQPEALEDLQTLEPPAYVAVVGKTSAYEGEDGEVYVSIKPESVRVVNEATRDRWVVEAAEQTLDRIQAGLAGESSPGEEDLDADLFEMAAERYGRETIEAVREKATEAVATLQAEQAKQADSGASDAEQAQAGADSEKAMSDGGDEHVCEVCGDSFGSEKGLSVHKGMMEKRDDHGGEQTAPAAD